MKGKVKGKKKKITCAYECVHTCTLALRALHSATDGHCIETDGMDTGYNGIDAYFCSTRVYNTAGTSFSVDLELPESAPRRYV